MINTAIQESTAEHAITPQQSTEERKKPLLQEVQDAREPEMETKGEEEKNRRERFGRNTEPNMRR